VEVVSKLLDVAIQETKKAQKLRVILASISGDCIYIYAVMLLFFAKMFAAIYTEYNSFNHVCWIVSLFLIYKLLWVAIKSADAGF